MHNCEHCPNKLCLDTGRPCKDMEKELLKEGIRGRNWIRKQLPRSVRKKMEKVGYQLNRNNYWREIPFSTIQTEQEDGSLQQDFGS